MFKLEEKTDPSSRPSNLIESYFQFLLIGLNYGDLKSVGVYIKSKILCFWAKLVNVNKSKQIAKYPNVI